MKTAALFPGNGRFEGLDDEQVTLEIEGAVDEASDVLGDDLTPVVTGDHQRGTQPAILAISVGTYRAYADENPDPDVLLGHSLGEYSALVASGALEFEDAVRLVDERERLMSRVEGDMVAVVGPDVEAVERACEGLDAYPANYNLPRQTVVSGRREALEEVESRIDRARFYELNVGAPSHTPLMDDAASELRTLLEDVAFRQPSGVVYSNVTASPYDVEDAPSLLERQLTSPVRWTATIEDVDADAYVELGPGDTLSGLVERLEGGDVAVRSDAGVRNE